MTSLVEMPKRVGMSRVLAAADVATRQADAKLVPRRPEREALLTAARPRYYGLDLAYVFAGLSVDRHF
jgi:hypothetical protein